MTQDQIELIERFANQDKTLADAIEEIVEALGG